MTKELAIRPVGESGLAIIKDDREYKLPTGWTLEDAGSYEFRNELQDKAFAHGAVCVGDGKVDGRKIKISFSLKGTDEQSHDEIVNSAYTYFAQSEFKLYCGRNDRVYKVAGCSKISHKWQKGYKQRWSTVEVTLLLAEPFRYEAQESKVTYTFGQPAVEAEMIIHNLGSVDTPLNFRFIPSERMTNITIWHQEAKEKFTLADALLIKPATVLVNGDKGTVWRDNANSINTFSGNFLHAKAGANLFLYTGGAGTIEITYTNRWFI